MEKKGISKPVFLLSCLLCVGLGAVLALGLLRTFLGGDEHALLQAERIISSQFVGEYDKDVHRQAVLRTMVDELGDRWSYYLTPEEYESVLEQRENSYVGIGVTIRTDVEWIEVMRVMEGGPAEEAGIQVGDIVQAVDGTAVTKENRDDCVANIRGEAGTSVTLELRNPAGALRTVEITRKTVQEISASYRMLENKIGLVQIDNFYKGTADLVEKGVESLQEEGARAIIFDVRNNPGGYVTELTQILDHLLPEGKIFVSRTKDGKERAYTSDADFVDLPFAVLVNGDSYSAAEFLAAQLKESAQAIVVGTQTSGKGYSQNLFPLQDGSAVGLSDARYFTGGGVSLIGTGLSPEPSVELSETAKAQLLAGTLSDEEDLQLQAAIKALQLED